MKLVLILGTLASLVLLPPGAMLAMMFPLGSDSLPSDKIGMFVSLWGIAALIPVSALVGVPAAWMIRRRHPKIAGGLAMLSPACAMLLAVGFHFL